MRRIRLELPFISLLGLVALSCATPVRAQDDVKPTVCYINGTEYPADSCECQGTCSSGSSSSDGSGGLVGALIRSIFKSDKSASSAAMEAARERAAEQKRLEGLERQQKIDEERESAQRAHEQQEFEKQVHMVAGQLKGVGGGNTPFFGLKGVSPDEAGAMIKDTGPDASARGVSTAAKQLTCAASISNFILGHVTNLVAGAATSADMDEIEYLAGEAASALQGGPVEVQCDDSGGGLKFTKTPDMRALLPAYKTALGNLVRDSHKLYDTDQQAAAAKQKADEATQAVEDLKEKETELLAQAKQLLGSQTSAKEPNSEGNSDAQKADGEQKAWRAKDEEKIKEVYEQQKKLQQEQILDLSLVRQAQAELNAINSQRVSETQTLTSDAKQVGALESGNIPQS